MLPQAAKWAECSSGTPTLPYHAIVQRDRKSWMRTIRARGMQEKPHQPERKRWGKSWTRRQELHDPGFYAAFPWGGYAQSKGDAPSTARPPITLPGGCLRPSWK